DDYPPAVDTLPHFSALPVDFEKIATLRPDLALATDQVDSPKDAETLTALGIPVYFFSFKTLQSVLDAIRTTGDLLKTQARANAAADSLQAQIDTLRARTARAPRPRVLMLIGDEELYAFGNESYTHELIRLAGGNSITDSIGTANPVLSEEFVLAARPDVIVGTWGQNYDAHRLVEHHPALASVPAIRSGRIYSLDPSLITRPGPRLIEGARRLAALLHPELFPEDRAGAYERRSGGKEERTRGGKKE
ncbi:MAG TPA: helical backbone metal receptor, partial [Rhodothermales bacterium]|nr:helical backbone metal receptor [Rhodothermales bacterium]